MRHREIALGLDRDVVRPQDRVAAAVDLVDRHGHGAVAVRVFEREVDPHLGRRRQLCDIEFARRNHDLAFDAVDLIAVDIDIAEGVVGAQALDLLQLGFERAPIPDARIAQRGCVFLEIGAAERGCRNREFLFFDIGPLEPIGPPRAGNAAEKIGLFQGYLVGADIELLDRRRDDRRCEIDGGEEAARRGPPPGRGEQPATELRHRGGGGEADRGGDPARDHRGIGRQPEMGVDKGGAGHDRRMPADDEVIAAEEAAERGTEAEQHAQHHPLTKPAFPGDPAEGEGGCFARLLLAGRTGVDQARGNGYAVARAVPSADRTGRRCRPRRRSSGPGWW